MVTYTCKCCGQPTDKPILFSPKRQRIFGYIWDNPNCTSWEIFAGINPDANLNIQTIRAHIRQIYSLIHRTEYRVAISVVPLSGKIGHPTYRYKIIQPLARTEEATTITPAKGTGNVTP